MSFFRGFELDVVVVVLGRVNFILCFGYDVFEKNLLFFVYIEILVLVRFGLMLFIII